MSSSKAKLIVLDINGLFCEKLVRGSLPADEVLRTVDTGKYTVVIRPGAKALLDFIYKFADVGFFSSTSVTNAKNIINSLLTKSQKKRAKFMWFRDRVQLDPDYGQEGVSKFDTVKNLTQIFLSPELNESRKYSPLNTLIIDDDFKKVRFNDERNILVVPSYRVSDEKDDTNFIISQIREKFEELEGVSLKLEELEIF
jgi:hypothetical protein